METLQDAETLAVAYTLTRQDYSHLHARAMKHVLKVRWLPWLFSLSILGSSLTLAILSPFSHGDWHRIGWTTGGLMLGWVIFFVCISRFAGANAYMKRPGALATHTVSLHPEGIRAEMQGMVTRLPWADVSEMVERDDYLEFSTGSYQSLTHAIAFFVPIRAFPSQQDASAYLSRAKSLQAAATAETSSPWTAVGRSDGSALSAFFPLTLGERGWMAMQGKQSTFFSIYLLPALGELFVFGLTWLQLGNIALSAVLSGVAIIMNIVMIRKIFVRGPITTGLSARRMGDFRVTITPKGIEQHSPAGLNWYPWPMMTQITEQSRYILFWAGRFVMCMVPLSAFGSADEAQAFLKTARDYCRSAKDGTIAPPTRSPAWPPPPGR